MDLVFAVNKTTTFCNLKNQLSALIASVKT